jgi:phenylacetate-CoA ligase
MEKRNNKNEYLTPNQRDQLQYKLLKHQLNYVYNNSPFYRKKFNASGIKPEDIKKIKDVQKIPFTTKEELRNFNSDFFCISMEQAVDIGATTGTSGTPIILPVTKNDWNNSIDSILSGLNGMGITKKNIIQLCLAFDQLFSVSTPIDDALKIMGATSVRTGPGNTSRQLELMKLLHTDVIFTTPDFMFILAEKAKEMGLDPSGDFYLEKAILIGQPLWNTGWKPAVIKKQLENEWGIEFFSVYGSMEMFTGFYECTHHRGHHTYNDYHYIEVIDPITGESLSDGEEGEIVSTHLKMQGVPLVRFRQGDITSIERTACSCGRTSPRIMAITGRIDNMLKVKGTSVFPQQIEDCIRDIKGVESYLIEVFSQKTLTDKIVINVSTSVNKKTLREKIREEIKSRTRITPEVKFVTKEKIEGMIYQNGTRKPKLFWDYRKKFL